MNSLVARRLCDFDISKSETYGRFISALFSDFEMSEIQKTLSFLLDADVNSTQLGNICDFCAVCFLQTSYIPGREIEKFVTPEQKELVKKQLIHGITGYYDAYKKSTALYYLREIQFELSTNELEYLCNFVHLSYPILYDGLLALLIQINRLDCVLNNKAISTDRFFAWAVIDYVKDTMDIGFKEYLGNLDLSSDPLLQRKMDELERTIAIYDRMIGEERQDYTEEEQRELEDQRYDFSALWYNLPRDVQDKQVLAASDMERLLVAITGQENS